MNTFSRGLCIFTTDLEADLFSAFEPVFAGLKVSVKIYRSVVNKNVRIICLFNIYCNFATVKER